MLFSLSSVSKAALIVDQSFDSSNIIFGAGSSQDLNSQFEDFTLTSMWEINQVSMWGVYWSSGNQPSSPDFRIQIRTSFDSSDVIYDNLHVATNVSDTGFNHNTSTTADILKFDFDMGGLLLDAGTYFIGVSSQNHPGTSFLWQAFSPYGDGFSGIGSFAGNLSERERDLTLAIDGQAPESNISVPSPAIVSIFLLGLGSIISMRLTKKS